MLLLFSPVTCKVFTNSSYIVAIAGNGNVYSYDAVLELNIKPKNYVDLLTGESFKKSDIITIQNVQDAEVMSRRDVSNFVHLSEVRSSNLEARKSDNKLRHNPTSESIMKEIEKTREKERELGIKPTTIEEISARAAVEENEDVADILIMKPLTIDVNPGQVNTDGKASSSFTSSATNLWTSNATRLASGDEIREAKWKVMRKVRTHPGFIRALMIDSYN